MFLIQVFFFPIRFNILFIISARYPWCFYDHMSIYARVSFFYSIFIINLITIHCCQRCRIIVVFDSRPSFWFFYFYLSFNFVSLLQCHHCSVSVVLSALLDNATKRNRGRQQTKLSRRLEKREINQQQQSKTEMSSKWIWMMSAGIFLFFRSNITLVLRGIHIWFDPTWLVHQVNVVQCVAG